MEHTLYQCPPDCDEPYCRYCQGGLAYCTTCKGGEGSLPTECPGSSIGYDLEQAVYAGKTDYINGQWVNRPSCNSPDCYRVDVHGNRALPAPTHD